MSDSESESLMVDEGLEDDNDVNNEALEERNHNKEDMMQNVSQLQVSQLFSR